MAVKALAKGSNPVAELETRLADLNQRRAELDARHDQVRRQLARIDGGNIDAAVNGILKGVVEQSAIAELATKLDAETRELRKQLWRARRSEQAAAVARLEPEISQAYGTAVAAAAALGDAVDGLEAARLAALATGSTEPMLPLVAALSGFVRQWRNATRFHPAFQGEPARVALALCALPEESAVNEAEYHLRSAETRLEKMRERAATPPVSRERDLWGEPVGVAVAKDWTEVLGEREWAVGNARELLEQAKQRLDARQAA